MIGIVKDHIKSFLQGGNRPQRFARFFTSAGIALGRIRDRGVSIATILDVGAYDGRWSAGALQYWPGARCHLIEANSSCEPGLAVAARAHPNFSYVLAAAGKEVGTAKFRVSGHGGGSMASGELTCDEYHVEVALTTLDKEVERCGLPGPFLIKLDTHGYEAPILKGAGSVLERTNLVVIETYVFDIAPESLKFFEICSLMEGLGFRVIDLSEPLWRPYDKSLWQMDLFFVRKERPEFTYNRYK